MAPSILVAGATGNTGSHVVKQLSSLLTCSPFSSYRIIALTRSASSPAAQALASLSHVQVIEQNWVDITADWLVQREVERAFIASHNNPNQFAEESTFHIEALNAGVKYIVRISTTAANVRPDCRAYYPRTHWAIEAMLGSEAFEGMHWTSLQPNIFSTQYLMGRAMFVKQFNADGKQPGPLALMASEDAPVGVIDPEDVGRVAAKLLLEKDTEPHNKAKYVLNGPTDITGKQVVKLVEEQIGVKVEDVVYKDMSFLEYMAAAQLNESRSVIMSIKYAAETAWGGKCTARTTSKEVHELAAPKRTPAEVFKSLLEG